MTMKLQEKLTLAQGLVAANHTLVETARTAFEALAEKQLHAEKSLPFLAETAKDAEATRVKLAAEEWDARNDVRKANIALDRKQEDVDDATVELNTTNTTVMTFKKELNESATTLASRRKEVDSKLREHNREQPFIVKHHGLSPDAEKDQKRKAIQVAHMG